MGHKVLLHVREHTWLWVAGFAALGAIMAVLRLATPAAFSFMVIGVLIMLKSQGTDLLSIIAADPLAPDDEAEVPEAGTVAPRVQEPVP